MEKFFGITIEKTVAIILATIIIFIVVIVLTRLSGKRSFSKMSSFDFASTIAIGSIIASGILLDDITPAVTIVSLAAIFFLQTAIAYFRRYAIVHKIIDNQPLLLMEGSTILYENLKSARVTEDDLRSKLRMSNVVHLSQVKAVILESTGDLSVLHNNDADLEVEKWILQGVKK
ncbi:DUF421 domain-containing protein [Flavobacterium ardleyense]|uniref:DUF421 domain-containing protein n=1 Tax=Flavobacterium ardleyense TaxID=2038737 RepID=UPI00298D2B4B|nr:YetF domain-containing protein [Flavobacterium ardleyense]